MIHELHQRKKMQEQKFINRSKSRLNGNENKNRRISSIAGKNSVPSEAKSNSKVAFSVTRDENGRNKLQNLD